MRYRLQQGVHATALHGLAHKRACIIVAHSAQELDVGTQTGHRYSGVGGHATRNHAVALGGGFRGLAGKCIDLKMVVYRCMADTGVEGIHGE